MTLYYTLNGTIINITERATLVPRKGDVVEYNGDYFKVKNVVWHLNKYTDVEVQLEILVNNKGDDTNEI